MNQTSKVIGKNIRLRRQSQKLSQDNLALLAGIDRSYYGRIERGEVNISVDKLIKLATALNCSAAELLP